MFKTHTNTHTHAPAITQAKEKTRMMIVNTIKNLEGVDQGYHLAYVSGATPRNVAAPERKKARIGGLEQDSNRCDRERGLEDWTGCEPV